MNESHHRQIDVLASALRRGTVSRRTFLTQMSALLASGAAVSLPGVARAQDAPKAGGVFRMGLHNASQNDNLDPGTWSTSWTGAGFNGGIYNNLVEILPDGSVAGDLAESWEPSDAAKVWRFKLKAGIAFHDGRVLVAEDGRQSIEHHTKPDSPSSGRATVAQLTSIPINWR